MKVSKQFFVNFYVHTYIYTCVSLSTQKHAFKYIIFKFAHDYRCGFDIYIIIISLKENEMNIYLVLLLLICLAN